MLTPLYPPKLHRGDTVRVIAPSLSRGVVLEHDHSELTEARFHDLGLALTFGEHVDERDDFDSAAIGSRVADLHAAFADPDVHGILTVIGVFNSNELLPHLDWNLIAQNPKVFCGYSDITALQNAILARTGLVTYSGPHWSTFGMRDHLEADAGLVQQGVLQQRTLRAATVTKLDRRCMVPRPRPTGLEGGRGLVEHRQRSGKGTTGRRKFVHSESAPGHPVHAQPGWSSSCC